MAGKRGGHGVAVPSEAWLAFSARYPAHPLLSSDPLYALTEPLIDAIKKAIPGFFTADQEAFERDLAHTASFGFFLGRPLGLTAASPASGTTAKLSLAERPADTSEHLQAMLTKAMRREGRTESEIEDYFQNDQKRQNRLASSRSAYIAWLIMNADFQAEVQTLRLKWEPAIRQLRRFPVLPRWPFFLDESFDGCPQECADALFAFYRRWGLHQMLTWDWPVPMEPEWTAGPMKDLHLLSDSGVILFLPWYLLRGQRLDVSQIVQTNRMIDAPDQLRSWLLGSKGRPEGGFDEIRYRHMEWLYRYYDLVLVRRYPDRIKRHLESLDRAMGTLMARELGQGKRPRPAKLDAESVKKLRLQLQRALPAPSA